MITNSETPFPNFQEHDELVQGLMLLRDYYKAEYKKALQDKVDHQRKTLQQRQRKLEEETRMSEQHQVCSYTDNSTRALNKVANRHR